MTKEPHTGADLELPPTPDGHPELEVEAPPLLADDTSLTWVLADTDDVDPDELVPGGPDRFGDDSPDADEAAGL